MSALVRSATNWCDLIHGTDASACVHAHIDHPVFRTTFTISRCRCLWLAVRFARAAGKRTWRSRPVRRAGLRSGFAAARLHRAIGLMPFRTNVADLPIMSRMQAKPERPL